MDGSARKRTKAKTRDEKRLANGEPAIAPWQMPRKPPIAGASGMSEWALSEPDESSLGRPARWS
jgi:hypothetical protein